MGRTIPSFRIASVTEESEWKSFRNSLDKTDRKKCFRLHTCIVRHLRIYFNNHYGGKAVVNAMQFKEMNGISSPREERKVLKRAQALIHGS
jgi:uncharacterized protein YecE (DUF72 family)